jgi:hypothetical protein
MNNTGKCTLPVKFLVLIALIIILPIPGSASPTLKYIISQPAWPAGVGLYEQDGTPVTASTYMPTLQVRANGGSKRLLEFGISGDAELATITVDASSGKAVASFSGIANVSATHSLYVPNTQSYEVYACPAATTLNALNPSCAGKVTFTYAECRAATVKSALTCVLDGSDYKVSGLTGSGLAEGTVGMEYGLDSGVRRTTDSVGDYSLTYNVRAGTYPHVYENGAGRMDLMVVNKPPRITDTRGIFDYSQVKGEVAWAALTLNLSAVNATIKFESIVDFTNTETLNLDQDINLSYNYIEVNTTTMTAFNRTAKLTLRNLAFQAIRVQKGGADCADCTVLGYDSGTAVFIVEPTLTNYRALELAGWVNWNTIDLANRWVGNSADNRGMLLKGAETSDNSLRQFRSSNASDASLAPKLEVNYTLRSITMYNNETLAGAYNLDDYFYDLDQNTLTFQSSADHPDILVTIHDPVHTVDIKPLNNWYGVQYVVFTASDGSGGQVASNNLTLNVLMGITTTTTATTTTNAAPMVYGIAGENPIILTAGGIKRVDYNVTVSDEDGCTDLKWVKSQLWDDSSTKFTDPENPNMLYRNDSCTLECSGVNGTVKCSFGLRYYTNASNDWALNISVYDGTLTGYSLFWNINVSTLAAVNISGQLLNFSAGSPTGRLNLSQTTSWDTTLSVQNVGNVQENALVAGSDMGCTIGAIPVANIKYHTSPATDYSSGGMCALSGNDLDTCSLLKDSFNLLKSQDGSPINKPVYWKLKVPDGGVAGLCNGTLTVGGLTT